MRRKRANSNTCHDYLLTSLYHSHRYKGMPLTVNKLAMSNVVTGVSHKIQVQKKRLMKVINEEKLVNRARKLCRSRAVSFANPRAHIKYTNTNEVTETSIMLII